MILHKEAHEFFPQLESLRGIAAIIVVLYHSPFTNGAKIPLIAAGDIFVDFFFVLSGFVMSHAYSSKIASGLNIGNFAFSRFMRLYPLHIFMMLVWLIYVAAKLAAAHILGVQDTLSSSVSAEGFLINLLLLQGMGIAQQLTWNAPSWSISVEFFAYLLFYIYIRTFHQVRAAPAILIILAGYGTVLFFEEQSSGHGILATYDFGFFRCVGGFFVGVLVWLLYKTRPYRLHLAPAIAIEILTVILVVTFVSMSKTDTVWQLLSVASFAALIYITASSHGYVRALLEIAPLRYLGRISYSIYMTHAIVIVLAQNFSEYVLHMPVSLSPGTNNPVIQTSLAWTINIILLIIVVYCSHFTWRFIELRGQNFGNQLIKKMAVV